MKVFLLIVRLGLGLFSLTGGMVTVGRLAGQMLPYMGDMAYNSDHDGYNKLYLMDVQRQFSFYIKMHFINDCCLTWSPEGESLTFVVDISAEGSTDILSTNFRSPFLRLTRTPGADLYPTYSPNGQQIAYTGYGYSNSPEIYVMNADGSERRLVTGQKLIVNINPHPVWSADGQSVLFSDFGNLNSLLSVANSCVDACEDAIQKTFDTNGLPLMTTSFIPLDPSRLFLAAFERTKQGGYGIYSLDTQSSKLPERLAINSGLASPAMTLYDHWIAFVSGNTDLGQPVDEANLYILDADCIGSQTGCAGRLRKIDTRLQAEDNISWSADGHWLAYVTVAERVSHLNLLDTTCIRERQDCTDYIHPMPISSSRYIRPAWRPRIQ